MSSFFPSKLSRTVQARPGEKVIFYENMTPRCNDLLPAETIENLPRRPESTLMPYRVLSHTADTGIEATGDSLASLIRELATGMFSLVATIEPMAAERWTKVRVESPSLEDLVVDTLSELVYLSEIEDLVFCAFRVDLSPGALAVTMEAGGVPVAAVEPSGPPIKAVTYHQLVVEEREDGWYGRVYFDV